METDKINDVSQRDEYRLISLMQESAEAARIISKLCKAGGIDTVDEVGVHRVYAKIGVNPWDKILDD